MADLEEVIKRQAKEIEYLKNEVEKLKTQGAAPEQQADMEVEQEIHEQDEIHFVCDLCVICVNSPPKRNQEFGSIIPRSTKSLESRRLKTWSMRVIASRSSNLPKKKKKINEVEKLQNGLLSTTQC